jgi:ssDNA-binding Zn-finger/Zn-ribbon topoisomerase 1
MIMGNNKEGFELVCNYCEDIYDKKFDSFINAVEFKTSRDNRWRSVIDANNDWNDLCPTCNCPEIINKLKGVEGITHTLQIIDTDQLVFEGW